MRDLEERVRRAVSRFWRTRASQSRRREHIGDRGARSAVTGGKQMDGFIQLVRGLLIEAGTPPGSVKIGARVTLPGWFRAEKSWDLAVVHGGELVAAVEFKSQIGPSFGNNFNNRTEEALGSATDLWAAFREGAFSPSSRPVLGYLMLVEDTPRSRAPVSVMEPHFAAFPDFHGASYCDRYRILVEKLIRDRLYDAACLLLAARTARPPGAFTEPHPELTFRRFMTPLLARVRTIAQ